MRKKKRKLRDFCEFFVFILIGLVFLCSGNPVFAAPIVSSVSGTVSNGNTITVSGSGFGATGPNIAIYDDFEKGANGNLVSTTTNSATVNEWSRLDEPTQAPARYSNDYAHSGLLSMRNYWGEGGSAEPGGRLVRLLGNATEVYFQYWMMIPVGGHVPGEGTPYGANWKIWNISGDPWPGSVSYESTLMTNVTDWPPTSWGFILLNPWYGPGDSLDSSQSGYHDAGYASINLAPGIWHRVEVYMKGGSASNGTLGSWQMSANQPRAEMGYSTTKTTLSNGAYYQSIRFPAYARGDTTSRTYHDDIYVATGSGARARVEIGNASTYGTSTNLAVATLTSWSNTSVQATVHQGSFTNGSAYLYVVDSTGAVNANGYPITIGGGTIDTPPTPPTNLGANATSSSSITVNWTAASDDHGVANYQVERCTGLPAACPDASFSQVGTANTSPFVNNTGLSADIDYSYRVRAVDTIGQLSGWTNTVSARTQSGIPVPIFTFSASPTSITSGTSSTLTWSAVTNATSCTASGGTFTGSKATTGGTQSVSPTSTTTYTLSCTGAGGTTNQSIIITVNGGGSIPTISSVSGTVSNGNVLTISGSGFGSTGPNIVLFDDFEKGTNGSVISLATGSATVNQWSRDGGDPSLTTYTTARAHSGTKSMQNIFDTTIEEPGNRMILDFNASTEVFYSFWTMIPTGRTIPGDGNSFGPNWKLSWLAGSGTWPDSDYISATVLSTTLSGVDHGGMGYDDMTTYNGRARYPDDTHSGENWWWSTPDWAKGQWKRLDGYHKGGQTTGTVTLTELTSSGRIDRISGIDTFTLLNGHSWTRMSIPGYGRGNTPNGMTAYDDIYFATGPGARARIEIGNNSTYSTSTNLAIITPTSWSNTSIQATVRQGSFTNGSAYLYVVDSTGAVNATGYPITIGGSTSSPIPCNTVTTGNFSQSAYTAYGAPYDLFSGNAQLVDAKCTSADPHTIAATVGKTGDTTRIVYTKGYYFDPGINNWAQYTSTCTGTLNGDWCAGPTTATITDTDISTASAGTPAYFVGMVCSVQGGGWKCGCRDTTCTNFYWMIQGAGM